MSRTQIWASGGGVQSAAIAALIVQGKLRPDLAVIVDTEREQSTTWQYMDQVVGPELAKVGVTLHRVRKSQFEHRDLYGGKDGNTLLLPVFSTQSGSIGKLGNYCSSHWKREVVKRWANAQGVKAVDLWLGISTDEMERVQVQRSAKWVNRYPLIEHRMNRGDCVSLVERMGWPTPPGRHAGCVRTTRSTSGETSATTSRPTGNRQSSWIGRCGGATRTPFCTATAYRWKTPNWMTPTECFSVTPARPGTASLDPKNRA